MIARRRQPRYKKKQVIRRRRMMMRKGKVSKYAGIRYIKETTKLDDIVQTDSLLGKSLKYNCSFANVSNVASFAGVGPLGAIKALYARYAITGVKWTFIPKYDTSSVGGAKASAVLYAINRDPQDTITGETDLIRQNDCKFTNSNRKFTVYVRNPTPFIASTANNVIQGTGTTDTQYKEPQGVGVPARNQVAVSYQGNKWTWLPTRVFSDGPLDAPQYPSHFGLDVHLAANETLDHEVGTAMYSVYMTLYIALKEQD